MKHIEHYKGWDIVITPERLLAEYKFQHSVKVDRDNMTSEQRAEVIGFSHSIKTFNLVKHGFKKYEAAVNVPQAQPERIYNLFYSHISEIKKLIDYQSEKELENILFQGVAKSFHRHNIEFKFTAEW